MQLHTLKPVHKNKPTMIVGRGGKRGKTSGRGGKGQTARAGNKRRPELRDFIKRLPKLRGRGINPQKSFGAKPFIVNLGLIEKAFEKNAIVTPATLLEKGLVSTFKGRLPAIKILGAGDFSKSVKVSGCLISASAKEVIEKAGGSVTI
jgi:large subunit ribosomal protein L15